MLLQTHRNVWKVPNWSHSTYYDKVTKHNSHSSHTFLCFCEQTWVCPSNAAFVPPESVKRNSLQIHFKEDERHQRYFDSNETPEMQISPFRISHDTALTLYLLYLLHSNLCCTCTCTPCNLLFTKVNWIHFFFCQELPRGDPATDQRVSGQNGS